MIAELKMPEELQCLNAFLIRNEVGFDAAKHMREQFKLLLENGIELNLCVDIFSRNHLFYFEICEKYYRMYSAKLEIDGEFKRNDNTKSILKKFNKLVKVDGIYDQQVAILFAMENCEFDWSVITDHLTGIFSTNYKNCIEEGKPNIH